MTNRSDVIGTAVIAAVVGTVVCALWFGTVASPPPDPPEPDPLGPLISSMYDPPSNAIEDELNKGDGQIYAGQATDPLARHPEMVRGGEEEQAYRYQRPMYGWIGWVASAGQRGAVAIALMAVTVASTVLLVYAVLRWSRRFEIDPRWSLLVLLLPGIWINLTWIGPETLGAGLALLGLDLLLRRSDRDAPVPWSVPLLLAAAGLCKETLLLVPLVAMAIELVHRRVRNAAVVASAAVPFALWVLYLRVQIGAWPLSRTEGRTSTTPYGGLFDVLDGWHIGEWIVAVGMLVLVVAALALGRPSGLRPYIAVNLAFTALLGPLVWSRYPDYSRVLLPLSTMALVAVLTSGRLPSMSAPVGEVRSVESVPTPAGYPASYRFPGRHPRG